MTASRASPWRRLVACITAACDFRIGADTARIGYGEVKLGINLMWHAVPICVHLIGPARAKQMIMTGKLFDAATLERGLAGGDPFLVRAGRGRDLRRQKAGGGDAGDEAAPRRGAARRQRRRGRVVAIGAWRGR